MIYIHPSTLLHTPEHTTTFNFSQSLQAFNAVLRKSLLVSIITIKKRSYYHRGLLVR